MDWMMIIFLLYSHQVTYNNQVYKIQCEFSSTCYKAHLTYKHMFIVKHITAYYLLLSPIPSCGDKHMHLITSEYGIIVIKLLYVEARQWLNNM